MNPDLDALAALLDRGHEMVSDLCKRPGEPGWRRWEMSIPARPDHDPDLVLGAALTAGDAAVAEVRWLRAETAAYRSALLAIARHVASPGAEDLADKLGVEDLPTLVECVIGTYTPKAGAEAEDLRRCMERHTIGPIADEMRAILDEVDARDSIRYLTEQNKPRVDVIQQLRERVASLEAAIDDGISIVMDFAPGHDRWLDNAAKLLTNAIGAADAAKEQG